MPVERPWYEEAFGAGYLSVYPHRELESARAEVAQLVEAGLNGRTLDLCCGFGRHTLAMGELGLAAFGLDLSRELLERSSTLEGGASLRGRLACGDARHLPFADAAFDAVTMLFSSFGYFDDGANAGVLAEVSRVLRPAGTAVFDLMNPERIRANLVPESVTRRDGFELFERRRLTEGRRRVVKQVTLRHGDGREQRWHEDVRMYEPTEFAELAGAHGLEPVRSAGDFDLSPLLDESPRQIVWCRRMAKP